jgi:hypothetical protein
MFGHGDEEMDSNDKFTKLANMIATQNDDELDDVEQKLMQKFKSLGKSVYNLKS